MAEAAAPRLVAGLGNPGPDYRDTRHNLGFEAVDRLAAVLSAPPWRKREKTLLTDGRTDGGQRVWMAKPQLYMNVSGPPLATLARFHKIAPRHLLVVLDDVAIPLGTLRLRAAGSAGGHNGLASVIESFGTDAIPRLRIGIGPKPERMDLSDFVLARATAEERETIEATLERAVAAMLLWIEKGPDAAANLANRREKADDLTPDTRREAENFGGD